MELKAGDHIEVRSVKVDEPTRRGEVLEVLAHDPFEVRVRWQDGHESSFFPRGGMVRVVEPESE